MEGEAAQGVPVPTPVKRNTYLRSLPQEARRGNVEVVRQLVEQGASLDEDVVGETALHFACFYGHLQVVEYLLSCPACRLNRRNLGGNTPLMRAVDNGHVAVVRLLLETAKQRGKLIGKRRNAKGETALHKAAVIGNVEVAQLLVEHGVEVSPPTNPDCGGDTPLHLAAERGHWPFVNYLLSLRESLELILPSTAGDPPSSSVPASSVPAVRAVLPRPQRLENSATSVPLQKPLCRSNMIRIDARNAKGRTPVHMPIVSGKRDMNEHERLEGIKLLANAGADINAQDASGRTPLHWAVFANYRLLVQHLLLIGKPRVDPAIKDVCGYTPAHIARNKERELLARALELYTDDDESWKDLMVHSVGRTENHSETEQDSLTENAERPTGRARSLKSQRHKEPATEEKASEPQRKRRRVSHQERSQPTQAPRLT